MNSGRLKRIMVSISKTMETVETDKEGFPSPFSDAAEEIAINIPKKADFILILKVILK